MEAITYEDVRKTLLPLLQKGESVDLDQLKGEIRSTLDHFLTLNEAENEFVTKLFESKIYRPNLLFEETEFNQSLLDHPGIEWRIQNID